MTLPVRPVVPGLSGERFKVRYQIADAEAEARSLAETARVEQSVEFPAELVPGGGMTRERIAELKEMYGSEVIFLVGGGLHRMGPDLAENVRQLINAVR